MRSVLRSVPIAPTAVVLIGAMDLSPARAQPRYGLLWDPALSSEAGAENLATLHRGFAAGTVGYKTDGFVLGEGLDEGPLVEIGLRLDASLLE